MYDVYVQDQHWWYLSYWFNYWYHQNDLLWSMMMEEVSEQWSATNVYLQFKTCPKGSVVSNTTEISGHSFRLPGSWGSQDDHHFLMWESDRCRHGMQQKGILAPRWAFRFAPCMRIFLHVYDMWYIDICHATRLNMLICSMLYLVFPCVRISRPLQRIRHILHTHQPEWWPLQHQLSFIQFMWYKPLLPI